MTRQRALRGSITGKLEVKIGPEVREAVDSLCAAWGVSVSEAVRTAILGAAGQIARHEKSKKV